MSNYVLAQLNVAQLSAPIDSPQLQDFVDNLDRINLLAEQSPGFVWRLQTEDGDATGIDYFGADKIVNMSLWRNVETLHNYVYRSAHTNVLGRRKEWFERMTQIYTVLWWIPEGTIPTLNMAEEKLNQIRQHGSTEAAFTFKHAYPAPDAVCEATE